MIGSVFAAGVAFTGTAAAATNTSLTASPNETGATGVTLTTSADLENDTQDTDYINVTSSDFDFSGVTDSDVTVTYVPTGETRDSSTGLVVDATADAADITLASSLSSSDTQIGGKIQIEITGVTNPSTAGPASVTTDLQTTSPNDMWDTWTVSTDIADSSPEEGANGDRGNAGTWSTAEGAGSVGSGATVYQGEDDIDFVDSDGSEGPNPAELERTGGASEGEVLEMPISEDAATGTYAVGGTTGSGEFNVTVQTPRVTMLEVRNSGNNDVSGGLLTTNSGTATVETDYNYNKAEDIELTVEDEDGLDVTDEIIVNTSNVTKNQGGDVSFAINPDQVDAGEYTFSVAGVDDLDYGEATETVSVTISSSQTASLSLSTEEVVQGENVQYTVENSPEGNVHAVTIEDGDFRDNIDDANVEKIFRNVGDTLNTGTVDGDAYAVVEIDGGSGVGSIETQYLDDSSIDLNLYPAHTDDGSDTDYIYDNDTVNESALGELTTDDDQSFDVTEGEVSLDSPSGAYVVGSEVTVNGTANEGTDDVALYARDNNDFELVEVDDSKSIEVDSDDTFEEEGVVLSGDNNGNDILSLPGTYRLGVIDVQDANTSGTTPNGSLTTSEFNGGVSSTVSIRVTDTELNGSFATYNGQVASEDESVDVSGTAPGKNELTVAFVDSRGNVNAQDISVDNDGTFDAEDLTLDNMSEGGTVSAHIISSGRDDTFGEGDVADDADEFASEIIGYGSGASSGEQVREQILANSVDDTASDDLIVTEEFRYVSGLTTIESVSGVEAGGTLTVEGVTNRMPDDNTITVELLDSEGDSVMVTSTDNWDTNGQWSVDMDLADVEPGEYTVESDDGDSTDRQDIEIVEEVEETTQEPTTTEEPTTQEPTTTEESTTAAPTTTEESAGTTEDTSGESGSGIPGFGMGIALVAVLGAALLALRQN
ncbi:HVO_2072 family ArtA-dependent S-layer glycoprotein [Halobacterium sp. NMX12-1]|uniref:HVO_2072 family ArtA-dependent S-layer glycoprotein n=1 Tax=Halobacterium sp. NMX12-1 TaxID=3166650 RepID=A0AAU8CIT4_9EURY